MNRKNKRGSKKRTPGAPGQDIGRHRAAEWEEIMNKHTPGPWVIVAETILDEENKELIAVVHMANFPDAPVAQANARLIAAAPEIYETLKWITRCAKIKGPAGTTGYLISDKVMEQAKAAIERQKGRK
jgi:hypothetical protein